MNKQIYEYGSKSQGAAVAMCSSDTLTSDLPHLWQNMLSHVRQSESA